VQTNTSSASWDSSLGSLLHFHHTLDVIAHHCVTRIAAEVVTDLWPITDVEALRERYRATTELVALLERKSPPPLADFPDIRPFLTGLEKGGAPLSAEDFGQVRQVLQAAKLLHGFLKKQEDMPFWRQEAGALNPWPEGLEEINRVVDEDLSIKSTASHTLQRIRSSIKEREARVRRRLAQLHQEAMAAGWGQDEPVAWREGRLVIALKASHKRKIKGLIHGHSGSGATAFVEPLEVFDLNNEIAALREDEQAEEARLLAELTGRMRPHVTSLDDAVAVLYRLDAQLAQARWAEDIEAIAPQISTVGRLALTGARNPVLAEHRAVVPLDLTLGEPERTLLVSGPNAGGKTVVLLTVGLFVMLAQSGLFVPAKAATLPLCQGLYADLGDRQSMEDDLSTFSAHLTNLKAIMTRCDRDSLVLMDELGTGTEPEAGAALGQTFLERIKARGAFCLATTHLNRLKLWAQDEVGILNAGMEFDPEELRPTYRLRLGEPGASYALEIARRMGLSEELLSRAQELLPDAAVNLEELLVSLEEDRGRLARRETELAARLQDMSAREEKLTGRETEIKAAHRRARKDALQEGERLIAETNRRLEATIAEIRSKGTDLSREDIRRAKGALDWERQRIAQEEATLAGHEPAGLTLDAVEQGMWVALIDQGRRGQVEQVSRGQRRVTVNVDGTRLVLPIDQLTPAEPPAAKPESSAAYRKPVQVEAGRERGIRLDLRGQRGDEAVAEVDRFLNNAILAGLREVEIIHGKGTGILQKLVHEFLAEYPQVKSYGFANFDAGGTGVTLVELK